MQPLTHHIIARVIELMDAKGMRKIKLGEVLGIRVDATSQAKAERANRFLTGRQKSVSIDEIKQIADFFEKPLAYFLERDATLAQPVKPYGTRAKKVKTLDDHLAAEGLDADERALLRQHIDMLKKRKAS